MIPETILISLVANKNLFGQVFRRSPYFVSAVNVWPFRMAIDAKKREKGKRLPLESLLISNARTTDDSGHDVIGV